MISQTKPESISKHARAGCAEAAQSDRITGEIHKPKHPDASGVSQVPLSGFANFRFAKAHHVPPIPFNPHSSGSRPLRFRSTSFIQRAGYLAPLPSQSGRESANEWSHPRAHRIKPSSLCSVGLGHPVLLSLRAAGDRSPVLALFPLFGALCKKRHVRDRRVIEQLLSIPQIRGGR